MNKDFFKSKEVIKILKIRDCDLMHLRQSGNLKYTKKGNAYLYEFASVMKAKR